MKREAHYRLSHATHESLAYLRGKWKCKSATETVERSVRIAEEMEKATKTIVDTSERVDTMGISAENGGLT